MIYNRSKRTAQYSPFLRGFLVVLLASWVTLAWPAPQESSYQTLIREKAAQGYAGAQFNLGRYYADEGNDSEAVSWYWKAAQQGHLYAEYDLFLAYEKGVGITTDEEQAFHWLGLAAEHGHPDAQVNFADRYESGTFVPKDLTQAVYWYRQAAEQGVRKAQAKLGEIYATGIEPLGRDDRQAAHWFELAAEQKDRGAQIAIGKMYLEGRGVEQSYPLAIKWLKLASDQGIREAGYLLGMLHEKGLGGPVDIAQAIKYYELAAATFNPYDEIKTQDAEISLGRLYLRGEIIPRDDAKAEKWLASAAMRGAEPALLLLQELAESGYFPAYRSLANIYDHRNSHAEAAKWHLRPAENGDTHSQYRLAEAYRLGEGMPRDTEVAAKWYRAAAKQGNPDAQYRLAEAYLFGDGVERDPGEAVKWYRRAAEQDNAAAQYALGEIYLKAFYFAEYGIRQDKAEAVSWFQLAASQGHPQAKTQLALLGEQPIPVEVFARLRQSRMAAMEESAPRIVKGKVRMKRRAKMAAMEESAPRIVKGKVRMKRRDEGPWAPLTYRVWYGTNRKLVAPRDASKSYSAESDQTLHFGYVDVFVPASHDVGSTGSLATSIKKSIKQRRLVDDRLKIVATIELRPDAFASQINGRLNKWRQSERMVLVYIHGFNVTFEDAAIRAAQIGVDLKIPGLVAFYSWPSRGSVVDLRNFDADQQTVAASLDHLADFLVRITDLAKTAKVDRIEIVAHSMGNLALLRVFNDFDNVAKLVGKGVRFDQVFLAAPAVSVEEFKRLAKAHAKFAAKTTLYVSPLDKAIGTGDFWEKTKLAGRSPPVMTLEGIETVEVKDIDLDFLGHSYLFEAREVLKDWASVLFRRLSPSDAGRGLKPGRNADGSPFWVLDSSTR